MRVYFFPDADGGVRLTADPAQPELELVNKVALGNGSDCTGWKDRLHSNAKTKNGVTQLTFSGTFPAGCTNAAWYLAMNSHPRYTTLLIANLWKELGGNWPVLAQQAAKIGAEASSEATPYGAPMLASSDSATLTDIIRDINKNSNNLMARLLFLTLGTALPSNSPNAAITERAAQNVQGWLQQKGLNFPELVLENGSGLSRNERISTAHLGQLLLAGWQSPYHGEFLASLPISGIDGTVKKRFTGSIVTGQAHLKTGTLNDVRALAGYVRAKSGQWVVVAAIINHPAAERGGDVLTATAEWVFENY